MLFDHHPQPQEAARAAVAVLKGVKALEGAMHRVGAVVMYVGKQVYEAKADFRLACRRDMVAHADIHAHLVAQPRPRLKHVDCIFQ